MTPRKKIALVVVVAALGVTGIVAMSANGSTLGYQVPGSSATAPPPPAPFTADPAMRPGPPPPSAAALAKLRSQQTAQGYKDTTDGHGGETVQLP